MSQLRPTPVVLKHRPQVSHRHLALTAALLFTVCWAVPLQDVYGGSLPSALVKYGAQFLVVVLGFYLVFALSRFWIVVDPAHSLQGKLMLALRAPISYFLFVARVFLLSGFEATSLLLLLCQFRIRPAFVVPELIMLLVAFLTVHVIWERRNLGSTAWEISPCNEEP